MISLCYGDLQWRDLVRHEISDRVRSVPLILHIEEDDQFPAFSHGSR